MADDLQVVCRLAAGGVWFRPTEEPIRTLARAVPPAQDPDGSLFRAWLPLASDLVGQVALATALVEGTPRADPELVGGALLGVGLEPRVAALTRKRVHDVQDLTRFSPWQVAEEYGLVDRRGLTRLGALTTRLTLRDRLEALVAAGTVLAASGADDWRLSAEALALAAGDGGVHLVGDEGPGSLPTRTGWEVLSALGALRRADRFDHGDTHFEVPRELRDRVAQISSGASPVLAVVRSMLDHDRQATLGVPSLTVEPFAPFVHGMRNKLRPLQRAAERLRESAPDPEVLQWVAPLADDLLARVHAIDRVVDQLSDLIAPIAEVRIALRSVVMGAVRELEEENGLQIEVKEHDVLEEPVADGALVREVVVELLRNARDAGAKHARIYLESRPGGGASVVVENDGPEISVDPDRLFEDGYSTKPGRRGRGLGLARASLLNQGAVLQLEPTTPHAGSTQHFPTRFRITFPGRP